MSGSGVRKRLFGRPREAVQNGGNPAEWQSAK